MAEAPDRVGEDQRRHPAAGRARQGPLSRSPCALLKLDFLTNAMHLLYVLVGKSSFSEAQGLRETSSWRQDT